MTSEKSTPDEQRQTLERWFRTVRYIEEGDTWQNYGPSIKEYVAFRADAETKATALFRTYWTSLEQICSFFDGHIQKRGLNGMSFWLEQIGTHMSMFDAETVYSAMRKSLSDKVHKGLSETGTVGDSLQVVAFVVETWPRGGVAFEFARDYFLALDKLPWTGKVVKHHAGLSVKTAALLESRYKEDPEAAWPLFCGALRHYPGLLNDIWDFREVQANRKALVEDAIAKIVCFYPQNRGALGLLLTRYMEHFQTDSSRDLLLNLVLAKEMPCIEEPLFGLCAFFKDDPATKAALILTMTQGDPSRAQNYAFELGYFHYYDNPEVVTAMVRALGIDDEDILALRLNVFDDTWYFLSIWDRSGEVFAMIMSEGKKVDRMPVFRKTCQVIGVDF